MTLLSVKGLHASLGGKPVLNGVSFSVGEGEFVGLIGPNGAGKSTLLRAALGLVGARGEVAIAGQDAAAMTARERARRIAYLPQEREIGWPVSVEMVVSLGRAPHRPAFAGLDAADRARIEEAMGRMELEEFRRRPATELSGGEKARVLIARALAQDAPLLLADEPTAGLDPSHQITLMRLFAELAREGRGVVASLHDLSLAARWCTRLILLDRGTIVADGPPREVLTRERLRSVYGVEAHLAEAEGGMLVVPLDMAAPELLVRGKP
ncbi:iron complex transport system ATP-binding protein [Mesorhizobium soli]|uniref:ABC transporter ATP-binding protein n=1 Tax=Pseudaminobacter soli (ex Li et al. 2025) TaxID=1295366 RepID=UPI002473FCAF|nr:ABC transporter ATP-binding protein [Mesorhizobium soli]MDH6230741.1 iron complex transport system ATP-binding protein [Mesorhizobium soli]